MTRHQFRQRVVAIVDRAKAIGAAFDMNDWFFFGGMFIAGRGGWAVSPRWTLVAEGVVFALVGLFGFGAGRGHSR